ncbi:MAG: hypothetical protein ISR58_12205 [Anaerolineales bacterium]|nr:hypothetical protein [Chloroflexota bacterium]MBL6981940.1 hypothetical protein [Anaerolineales bacterium]
MQAQFQLKLLSFLLVLSFLACNLPNQIIEESPPQAEPAEVTASEEAVSAPTASSASSQDLPTNLIQPEDLTYLGAFRLPDGGDEATTWEYGGQALAFNPNGDPGGEVDGFPGSLFGSGHDIWNYVSEVSIPAPLITRDIEQLPIATTLQDFQDVSGGLFNGFEEMPRVGLEALPPMGEQSVPKLYLAWGTHHHDEGSPSDAPTHAWCDLDLANPNTQGAWRVGDESLYSVNGYMFQIDHAWADTYLGGAQLATGRYRDGGWSGKGPTLFAIAPWDEGNPPDPSSRLTSQTLLRYSMWDDPESNTLRGYHDADEWEGGAWLTSGDETAVIIVGSKGGGDYWWYGYASPNGDGMPCPAIDPLEGVVCFNADGTPCAEEASSHCEGYLEESKGCWSSRFDAQILFYNPEDFAAVLASDLEPFEPQPFAVLDIDEFLYLDPPEWDQANLGLGDQRRYRLGEIAYDREHGFLYIVERYADGAKPVVHVWSIQP